MSAVTGSEPEHVVVAPGVRPPLAVPRRLLRLRSDVALAERFAAGDEAAFDVIYERHRPVVLAVCMGVLGAPADAEDATQETFSALAVALRTRPPAELRPWLIRVARNASIDTTRRRRHRLLTIDGEIPEVAARPASSGKAELAVVLDGIRELPEGQRMALLMRELGGHSYSEIADFLDTDEESVKGLIARARVGLRSYREATELSCSSARATIAAEPDGRRYDKTIRRHLRTCGACRSYRAALRDDAKALRAALPIQAGTVATGGLSGGMLTAAKGSLLTYGLTQAATTCAASACAVGAIGGMVFVAPVHRLGLPPIFPVAKTAPAHKHHVSAKAAPAKHVVLQSQTAATVYQSESAPAGSVRATAPSGTAKKAAVTVKPSAAVVAHRHHEPVTRVHLPKLPSVHNTSAPSTPVIAAPGPAATTVSSSTTSASTSSSSSATIPTGQGAGQPTGDPYGSAQSSGSSQSGTGQSSDVIGGNGSQPTIVQSSQPTTDQSSQPTGDHGSQPTTDHGSQPTGDHGSRWGTDPGSRPVGGEHHVGPVHVLVGGAVGQPPSASAASASSASSASTTVPATGATPGETTSTSGVTTTTSPSYTRPTSGTTRGANWQRDQSGARHTATGRPTPTTTQASSPTTTTAVASSPTIASTTTTPATDGGYRPGADGAPSQQYGRGQQTDSSSSQPSRDSHWGGR